MAASPRGGPYNTGKTIGRLGLPPAFLGRLSNDRFGRMLRARLGQDGVTLGVPQLTDARTTLAAVDHDPGRAPRYRFYLAGTSSAALEYPSLSAALPGRVLGPHAGTLALAMEPTATSIEQLITRNLPPGALVWGSGPGRRGSRADGVPGLARLLAAEDHGGSGLRG